MTEKEYLINVDLPEASRIHLNPRFYQIDPRCETGIKNVIDGGTMEVAEQEALEYLNGTKPLFWETRKITNLQRCKLCSLNPDFLI